MKLVKHIAAFGMALVTSVAPAMTVVVPAAVVAVPVTVISLVVDTNTQSADAAVNWNRPSRVYNNTGGWIPMYPVPTKTNYPTNWTKPGSVFYMDCWVYGQSYAGSYISNIWFYGYNGNWGYINSSYVYNQISVPRC